MKIAVLAIALNEEAHVARWAASAKDADSVILVDTGSTDSTIEIFKKNKKHIAHQISVRPWRFDVARNAALALVPNDIDVVVNLDLDEVLMPGWRKEVEAVFADPTVTRLHYDYIWSFNPDGSPGVRFYRDMIHRRHGYLWKHPCHETLYHVDKSQPEKIVTTDDVKVEHHADHTKSRGQYFDLLEIAVKEDMSNDRMAHYNAREKFFNRYYEDAIHEFERHLALPSAQWSCERAESMIYISKCYENLGDLHKAHRYAILATMEDNTRREPHLRASQVSYNMQAWVDCLYHVQKSLGITTQAKFYMNDPMAYGAYLYDIGFVAAVNCQNFVLAAHYIDKALEFHPTDERLLNNKNILQRLVNDAKN